MKEDKKKDLPQQENTGEKNITQRETDERENVNSDSDDVQTQIPGTDRTEEGYRIIESGLGVDE